MNATSATWKAGASYLVNPESDNTLHAVWTNKSTISSYEIKNLTSTGYDVYLYGVTDPNGINRVQFPTWTVANNQDDIDVSWESSTFSAGTNHENGTWSYRVNITDHNNESGTYTTHVYVYDNNGDRVNVCSLSVEVPVPISVYIYNGGTLNISLVSNITFRGNDDCSLSKGTSSFKLNIWNGDWGTKGVSGVAYFDTPIDLTNYKRIVFEGSFSRGSGNPWNGIGIWSSTTTPGWTNHAASSNTLTNGISFIDVSDLEGLYYVGVWGYYTGTSVTCNSMILET